MCDAAIHAILAEHRSLAAAVHGLRFVVNEARSGTTRSRFRTLAALLRYIDAYPERLHHPKEEAFLFARLRKRTSAADDVLAELQSQHARSEQLVSRLHAGLLAFEAGEAGSLAEFADAVERFADAMWTHMATEEDVVLPLARRHLTAADWRVIAEAFGDNGDPLLRADSPDDLAALCGRVEQLVAAPRRTQ